MNFISVDSRLPARLLLLAGLLVAGVLVIFPVFNYDLFWHLANGKAMLQQGVIINQEIFSYTALGTPFSNHAWLSQILLYPLYEQFGATGLLGFKLLVAVAVFLLCYQMGRAEGLFVSAAVFLALLVIAAGLSRYIVRPHLFSLLGLAVLSSVMLGYLKGRLSSRWLWLVAPLIVLWEQLHGALYGMLWLAVMVGAESVKPWLSRRFAGWTGCRPALSSRLQGLWFVALATLLLSLLNPYGVRSYDFFTRFGEAGGMAEAVAEFAPPGWEGYELFWLLVIWGGLLLLRLNRRLDITRLALFILFALLGARYSRATAPFAIAAVPLIAAGMSELFAGFVRRADSQRMLRWLVLLAWAVLLGWVVNIKFIQPPHLYSFAGGLNEDFRPLASSRFIKELGLQGRMYNNPRFGGELAFFNAPQQPIYQYNHHVTFGALLLSNHSPGQFNPEHFDYAVIGDEREVRELFPPSDWATVFREPAAAVLLRRSEQNRPLIERFELRHFKPLMSETKFAAFKRSPAYGLLLSREMADYLHFRHDPFNATRFGELLFALADRLTPEVINQLVSRTERFNAGSAAMIAATGLAAQRRGDLAQAQRHYSHSLALDPGFAPARLAQAFLALSLQACTEARAALSMLSELPGLQDQVARGWVLADQCQGEINKKNSRL